jgi:hypothetical protein
MPFHSRIDRSTLQAERARAADATEFGGPQLPLRHMAGAAAEFNGERAAGRAALYDRPLLYTNDPDELTVLAIS